MRVHFADIDAAPTRYYEAGDGPPLLLVHGIGVTAEIWLRNIAPLARSHRVCAPDLLASGLTGAGRYGVEQTGPILPYTVDHLLALADHLRFDRFAIAGSSLGGLVFAARRGARSNFLRGCGCGGSPRSASHAFLRRRR